jgi:hypothetical protein
MPLAVVLTGGRRLRMANGLSFGTALLQELRTAREGAIGRQVEAREPGHHGDLMTAVALAVWGQSPLLA